MGTSLPAVSNAREYGCHNRVVHLGIRSDSLSSTRVFDGKPDIFGYPAAELAAGCTLVSFDSTRQMCA